MRGFILWLALMSFQTFGQVNLGKVCLQHSQYLLTFDKVIYPNKSLKLENIRFTQYMKGVKVKDVSGARFQISYLGSDKRVQFTKPYDVSFSKFLSDLEEAEIIYNSGNKDPYWMSEITRFIRNDDTLSLRKQYDLTKPGEIITKSNVLIPLFDGMYTFEEYNLIPIEDVYVGLTLSIRLDADLNIVEEQILANVTSQGEEFGLILVSGNSNIIKRAKNDQVEEVRITNEIDVETNEWTVKEEVLSTRPLNKNEVADMHGNIYNTVKIGDQVWMAENLRTTAFNDGTVLTVLNEKQWANTSGPGLVEENSEGNYYNFYTLLSDKNICPQGFRVPDEFDIETLYNEITPYDEQIKISSSGVVKRKVYAPLLAPIVMPVSAAVHLSWWGIGTGLSGAAIGTAAVLDAAYLLPWTALDLLVVGPIAGWSTKNKKRKHAYRQALSNSEYVDTLGYSLKLNRKGKWVRISMIPKEKWGEFKLAAVSKDSTTVTEISDPQARSRMQRDVADAEYHLTYKAFPTLKFKPFLSAFLFDDLLGSMSEVFYQKLMAFSPWREVTSEDYPYKLFRTETLNFKYQPVLTQLLAQGEDAEFADLYRFSLNFGNTIGVPRLKTYFRAKDFITGISYNLNGSPGVWGLYKRKMGHELSIMQEAYSMDQGDELYRLSTRVRCVSTNSSNK